MPKVSHIQNSFNSGEISPLLYGRTDVGRYANGVALLKNFVPTVQGALIRRSGSRFVAEVKTSSKATRIVAFEFSNTQSYILEFGDQYIRFYKDNGQIVSGGSAYEITSPYLEADLFQLKFAQSADVLYIAHPGYSPRKLSRTGHTAWTLTQIAFDWPPFFGENLDSTKVVTASALTGSITLTSTTSIFTSDHVGAYWRLGETMASKYDEWNSGLAVTSGDKLRYLGNVYQASSTGTTGTRPLVHTSGTESDGALNWLFLHSGIGYAKITGFTSGTSVSATVIERFPDSVTSGTERWAEGAWSDLKGYPGCVTFYEDRLVWAGSSSHPQSLWFSRTGDYENLSSSEGDGTVVDDHAILITLSADNVNVIIWMQQDEKGLIVGTIGGEWIIRSSTTGEAIAPSNVQAKRSTTHGSANIEPKRVGKAALYVQRAARKIREVAYVYEVDGFQSPDMTVFSEHITAGGIKEIDYQQEPQSLLWAVRDDGTLLGFTYEREQDVLAWHRHVLGGVSDSSGTQAQVESVAVIPASSGKYDELWIVVKRWVDGAVIRTIEYIEKLWEEGDDAGGAFFLDSGLSYSGAATTTLSGLSHLEGETVSILADGSNHPDKVVTSGGITLDRSATKVHVGLAYQSDGQTLNINAGAADGTAQGKTKRIHRVIFRLHQTLGMKAGPNANTLDTIYFRTTATPLGSAPALFSGDKEMEWPGDYETEGQIYFRQDQPLPMTVLAIMPQLVTQDR